MLKCQIQAGLGNESTILANGLTLTDANGLKWLAAARMEKHIKKLYLPTLKYSGVSI